MRAREDASGLRSEGVVPDAAPPKSVESGPMLTLLRALSNPDVPPRERNAALSRLYSLLCENVDRFPRFRGSKGGNRFTADENDRDSAVVKATLEASRLAGNGGIQATSEAGAWAWVRTVMANHLTGEWRRSGNQKSPRSVALDRARPAVPAATLEWSEREIHRLLARVREWVERGQGAASGFPPKTFALECYLGYRSGEGIEEQMRKYGFAGPYVETSDGDAQRRARDRVYQYRKRGADALAKALEALRASGAYEEEEIVDAAAMFSVRLAGLSRERVDSRNRTPPGPSRDDELSDSAAAPIHTRTP